MAIVSVKLNNPVSAIATGVFLLFTSFTVLCILNHYSPDANTAEMVNDCLAPAVGSALSLGVTLLAGLAEQEAR